MSNPTICNIAYKGNAKTIEPNGSRRPYMIWKNMINRCYNPKDKSYRFYGGVGVRVSESWLTYENFRNDIEELDGYDEEKFYSCEIQLDKDMKNKDAKLYSKETCVWMTQEKNKGLIDRVYRPKPDVKIVALSPSNEVYCVIDIPIFSKYIGIRQSDIYGVISKSQNNKTAKGWCFKRVTDFSNIASIKREEYEQKKFGPTAIKYKIEFDSKVLFFNHVDEASEYLGCSSSLLTQRTRQFGEYLYKNKYKVSRFN